MLEYTNVGTTNIRECVMNHDNEMLIFILKVLLIIVQTATLTLILVKELILK